MSTDPAQTLADHIADQPTSVVQRAFRLLGIALHFELRDLTPGQNTAETATGARQSDEHPASRGQSRPEGGNGPQTGAESRETETANWERVLRAKLRGALAGAGELRDQRARLEAELVQARSVIDRVRQLHFVGATGNEAAYCSTCTAPWPCPTAAAIDQPDGQRFELPTVIHRTPEQLRAQRAQLIASTGLTEQTLRDRAERYLLDTEDQLTWNTIQGIDYLLDQPDGEGARP